LEQQWLKPGFGGTKEKEIDLGEIISALFRWWWVTALCLVVASLAAYSFTKYTYVPIYTASGSLVINSQQTKEVGENEVVTNDVSVSAKLVQTYTAILTSHRVMGLVSKELELDLPAAELREQVTVEQIKGTEVLQVMVNYPDPVLAAAICNAIMWVTPEAIAQTVEVGSINVLDDAQVPALPNPPALLRNVGVGALLGLLLGLGLVLLLLYFDNTVKNGDDVQNKLGLTLLGSIPYVRRRAMGGRAAPLLTSEQAGFGFIEACKAAGTNLRFAAAACGAKKLLVSSTLAGEGKSTVSVNLALALAQAGKSVLLVDCDLRKSNVHRVLNIPVGEAKGLAAVLSGEAEEEGCIVWLKGLGIHVLPNASSVPNPSELLGSDQMAGLLAALENSFDYIILDTPPAYLLTDAVALSVYADGVVLVVRQGYAKIDLINLTKAGFANAGVRILGCVLSGIRFSQSGAFSQYQYNERYLGRYYKDYARVKQAGPSFRGNASGDDD